MNKFCIVAKKDEISVKIENKIEQELCRCGWEINKEKPELVICVGGDGTFLHAIHKHMNNINNCCFLAIHTGTLGFFTDYTSDEVEECNEEYGTHFEAGAEVTFEVSMMGFSNESSMTTVKDDGKWYIYDFEIAEEIVEDRYDDYYDDFDLDFDF